MKIKRQMLALQRHPGDSDIEQNLADLIADLEAYRLEEHPYASMSRQRIDPQLPEMGLPRD